jgi:hypothetical protein
MISVSEAYKNAINTSARHIQPKVLIYFEGENNPPTEFYGDIIQKITLLEELKADTDNPLSLVSSNEITIDFVNISHYFTPSNINSIYYGKLLPNIMIKPYLGLEISPGTYEWIPLGVFWSSNWNNSSENIASVTGYDKIYKIGELSTPMIRAQGNTTIYDLFITFFTALGLTSSDYIIDTSLKQYKITLGWYSGTVREVLQKFAIAGNCNIITDRYGVIRVKSNFNNDNSVATLTDIQDIYETSNPQDYSSIFSVVKVNYTIPSIQLESELLKIENFKIPNGTTVFNNISFTEPVYSVSQVNLIGSVNAVITDVKYGSNSITITVNNSGQEEIATLQVIGQSITTATATYTAQDNDTINKIGIKTMEINNEFIQNLDNAKDYATSLLFLVKNPLAKYIIKARGNMAIEVGDIITIVDSINKIPQTNVLINRMNMEYNGSLECDINAEIPIIPFDWVYISPGLYIYTARNI